MVRTKQKDFIMTKKELFKKYSINKSHNTWADMIDNWMSIEIFRIMHQGRLPTAKDKDILYVLTFLDKFTSNIKFLNELRRRDDFGSLYLTAKRMVCTLSDQILEELKTKTI